MLPLRITLLSVALGLLLVGAGCSGGRGTVTGKLSKGGQPLKAPANGRILLLFHAPAEGPAQHSHPAEVNADGSFSTRGSDGKGLTPGKYRISVEVMSSFEVDAQDTLEGQFSPEKSTIVRDVKPGTDIVIDLDRP